MTKWVILGLVGVGAFYWFFVKDQNALPTTSGQSKATSANSGFNLGVTLNSHGIQVGW